MKQKIQIMLATLGIAVLTISLALPLLRSVGLTSASWHQLAGRNHGYFKTRQWLADLRTLAACARYLYESRTTRLAHLADASSAWAAPARGTNFSTYPLARVRMENFRRNLRMRMTRIERMEGRSRLALLNGVAPLFELAESSSSGADFPFHSRLEAIDRARRQATNATLPSNRIWRASANATNLQGA